MTVTVTKQSQSAAYAVVQSKPFTRIPGLPTKKYRDGMYEGACDMTTAVNVDYEWAGEFILLAIVTGGNKNMELTTNIYIYTT